MPHFLNSADEASTKLAKRILLALAALWCLYWFVHAWHYWEDDAYIHLEFARSVASGEGFAFNGHVVAGDTAPFWVLLLVAMHALIPKWLIAGKVLTVLGAIFGLSGIYAFARRLAAHWPGFPQAPLFPAAVILLIVLNPYSCYWLFSGMEPIAAAGLACFAVLAATSQTPSARVLLAGCFLAGIAPLVRPEMIFLTALVALPLLGQWRRLPHPASSKLPTFVAGLILIALPLTLWSIYSLHAFGHILPNTNAAKRAPAQDSVTAHLLSIYTVGLPVIILGFLGALIYIVLRPAAVHRSLSDALAAWWPRRANGQPQHPESLPLAGWIFILWPLITSVFYVLNHTYVQTRYILVTAPGLTTVILAVALNASRRAGRAVYVFGLVAALAVSLLIVRPFIANKAYNCLAVDQLAQFIHDHLPADAPVAMFSIGQVAFVSQHPIVDTGGITRPAAIPYLDQPVAAQVHWAESQGAQYYIGIQPDPAASLVFSIDQRYEGWSLDPRLYAESSPVQLWKLAPVPAASAPH
jgi:hypothetical protein